MSDRAGPSRDPRLDRAVQARLGALLRSVHMPPELSPIPDEHVELVLALRRKERERRADEARARP